MLEVASRNANDDDNIPLINAKLRFVILALMMLAFSNTVVPETKSSNWVWMLEVASRNANEADNIPLSVAKLRFVMLAFTILAFSMILVPETKSSSWV